MLTIFIFIYVIPPFSLSIINVIYDFIENDRRSFGRYHQPKPLPGYNENDDIWS